MLYTGGCGAGVPIMLLHIGKLFNSYRGVLRLIGVLNFSEVARDPLQFNVQ